MNKNDQIEKLAKALLDDEGIDPHNPLAHWHMRSEIGREEYLRPARTAYKVLVEDAPPTGEPLKLKN